MTTAKYNPGQKVTVLKTGHPGVIRSYDPESENYFLANNVTGEIEPYQESALIDSSEYSPKPSTPE